jgi:phosphopantetheine--protein transferase-like protein
MEQKIKEIVAKFIRVPAEQIGPATPIDRSAVQSSILLHRMYARLEEIGLRVENHASIKVFGDLSHGPVNSLSIEIEPVIPGAMSLTTGPTPAGVGIDIEEIAALPRAADFREEAFYKMNFTPQEIAYCILQPDSYASFAGLFAAKEAINKADGSNRNRAFNTLEIDHSPEGKPLHPGFGISISHAGGMAVAVAVRDGENTGAPALALSAVPQVQAGSRNAPVSWIVWMALLLSVSAILIVLLHSQA